MSTKSSLRDLFGHRVHIRDVPRVDSGSPGKFLLQSERYQVKGPSAALALAKRHVSLRDAHELVTRLFDHGVAVVELPMVESVEALTRDLAACNVTVKAYAPPSEVDVKAIRETMGMSQEQFALEFGLELATVRNWEQGRSQPDTAARNFLITVARDPDAVRHALVTEE
jgi:DNA-binding transcriptional regulator YiaG